MNTPRARRLTLALAVALALAAIALPAAAVAMTAQEPAATPDPAPSSAPEPVPDLSSRIDAYLQPFIDAGHLSGYLLVARGDETAYERGFGRADYELDVAVGPETRFCVASVNKPMTIVVALRLIEEGKLRLEDPVGKWLPGFPRGETMTVDHLLNHRAGIPHRLVTDEQKSRAWTAAELVEEASKAELAFEPGADNSYSSGGYSVLVRILELAGGKSYEELLREYLFTPAGMTQTAPGFHEPLMPNRARSYFFGPGGILVNAPPRDLSHLIGAGAAYSTARDLLAMMRAILDGRLGATARAELVDEDGLDWNGLTHGFRAFADYHQTDGHLRHPHRQHPERRRRPSAAQPAEDPRRRRARAGARDSGGRRRAGRGAGRLPGRLPAAAGAHHAAQIPRRGAPDGRVAAHPDQPDRTLLAPGLRADPGGDGRGGGGGTARLAGRGAGVSDAAGGRSALSPVGRSANRRGHPGSDQKPRADTAATPPAPPPTPLRQPAPPPPAA